MEPSEAWVRRAERLVSDFAKRHGHTYAKSKRQLYAAFEVGCYLALVRRYEQDGYPCEIQNLEKGRSFRFLTTPSGNPANFSYVVVGGGAGNVQVRQQVRVRSHIDPEIAFTPDIVVLRAETDVSGARDPDYGGGKRRFFCVSAEQVIAAHECKSLEPFPELLVSFIGILMAAHDWLKGSGESDSATLEKPHLAPTLFIGGTGRPIHQRMIRALCKAFPMNVVQGLHYGTWDLDDKQLRYVNPPTQQP